MEQALLPFKRYAQFDGRATRTEYWGFALINILVYLGLFILMLLGMADGQMGLLSQVSIGLLFIYALAVLVPSYAVMVRRFHDQNRSGWMCLICLVPYLGGLIVTVFMFLSGTDGANQYGPNPR